MTGTGNGRKKAGQAGTAKLFITRTQAVKKLQISLPDFRRLCIFKGVYPREPRYRKKVSKSATQDTTFYYTKDIQYLLHEPVLHKFREHKAFAKKLTRYFGRGDDETANRLERTQTPKITLDHIIKERYPTFVDAIRDLDDALCLLFLFANLPTSSTVPPSVIAQCQKLCFEFQHYIITSRSLRKSFLSIKGVYYQAEIHGQDVMWIVPYSFMQRVTADVDYRIMATFIEFYSTLLGFVNFKLYAEIGLMYPPRLDSKSVEQAGGLRALQVENQPLSVGNNQSRVMEVSSDRVPGSDIPDPSQQLLLDALPGKIAALVADDPEEGNGAGENLKETPVTVGTDISTPIAEFESNTGLDTFLPTDEKADILDQPQGFSTDPSVVDPTALFSDFTFFLSRETPRSALEFLLRAFGCKRVGWDEILGEGAFTNNERDPRITHQVVDRPSVLDSSEHEIQGTDNSGVYALVANPMISAQSKILKAGMRVPGRIYVQPQWIWDCLNAGKTLRPDLYAPGATLPPHLSPWIKPGKGEYDPEKTLDEQESEAEAVEGDALLDLAENKTETGGETEQMLERKAVFKQIGQDAGGEMDVDTDGEEDVNDRGESDEGDEWAGFETEAAAESASAMMNLDDPSDEEADLPPLSQHQRELEAESYAASTGAQSKTGDLQGNEGTVDVAARLKRIRKRRREEEEELERRKGMLSGKKKRVYESLSREEKKRDDESRKLRQKRRELNRQQAVQS